VVVGPEADVTGTDFFGPMRDRVGLLRGGFSLVPPGRRRESPAQGDSRAQQGIGNSGHAAQQAVTPRLLGVVVLRNLVVLTQLEDHNRLRSEPARDLYGRGGWCRPRRHDNQRVEILAVQGIDRNVDRGRGIEDGRMRTPGNRVEEGLRACGRGETLGAEAL